MICSASIEKPPVAMRILPNRAPSLDKKQPRNKRPTNEGKDRGYLAWLHQLPCCVTLAEDSPDDPLEAHHPTVGRGRAARKEDDATAVPVVRSHHKVEYPDGLHHGEAKFWNRQGIDPTALADDLYAAYSDGKPPAVGREIIDAHRAVAVVRRRYHIKIFQEKI